MLLAVGPNTAKQRQCFNSVDACTTLDHLDPNLISTVNGNAAMHGQQGLQRKLDPFCMNQICRTDRSAFILRLTRHHPDGLKWLGAKPGIHELSLVGGPA